MTNRAIAIRPEERERERERERDRPLRSEWLMAAAAVVKLWPENGLQKARATGTTVRPGQYVGQARMLDCWELGPRYDTPVHSK